MMGATLSILMGATFTIASLWPMMIKKKCQPRYYKGCQVHTFGDSPSAALGSENDRMCELGTVYKPGVSNGGFEPRTRDALVGVRKEIPIPQGTPWYHQFK